MAIGTLNAIRAKFRRLTGSGNAFIIPDVADVSDPNSVGIDDYINSFYNYDFPAQFRSLKLKDVLTFDTVFGVDTYAFDSEKFTTIEQPVRCMKREIALFQDPWSFYAVNFNWQSQTNFATGNGTSGPYSGVTTGRPIIRSVNNNPTANLNYPASRVQNVLITVNLANGNTLNVTDDGNGLLIGDVSSVNPQGTINYATGQIAGLFFSQAVPGGSPIQIQYNPVQPSIPLSMLFFQNQFTLRPVPDRGYTVEMIAYRQPTQALANTPAGQGTPELLEWWETLAFGASKKLFQDRMDMEGVAMMDKFLNDAYQLNYTRTYAELGKRRVPTIYADQLSGSGGGSTGFGTGSQ